MDNLNNTPFAQITKPLVIANGKYYRLKAIQEKATSEGRIYRRYDYVASDDGVWMEYEFTGRSTDVETSFQPGTVCEFI